MMFTTTPHMRAAEGSTFGVPNTVAVDSQGTCRAQPAQGIAVPNRIHMAPSGSNDVWGTYLSGAAAPVTRRLRG